MGNDYSRITDDSSECYGKQERVYDSAGGSKKRLVGFKWMSWNGNFLKGTEMIRVCNRTKLNT